MRRSELSQVKTRPERWFPYALSFTFLFALLVGLHVSRDYGLTFDEPVQRDYGRLVYEYVLHGNTDLFAYPNRFYGPFFEFVLYAVERIAGVQDISAVYWLRHAVTFLFFFAGALCFYGVARRLFNNRWLGLLGVIFLFLSPRIFADAFYNSKDIALLAAFTIAMWTLLVFRERRSILTLLFHALACAAAVDIRLIGALASFYTVIFWLLDTRDTRLDKSAQSFRVLLMFLVSMAAFVTALWPTLWQHPVSQLSYAVRQNLHYPWPGIVFFRGRYIYAERLPWYYLPLWISITMPALYLLLGALGAVASTRSLTGRLRSARPDIRSLLPILWFFVPLILVIGFRSTVYDGWRHLYFIYPAWLLLVLRGIDEVRLLAKPFDRPRRLLAHCTGVAAVAAALGSTLFFMIRNHPLQNLFFSSYIGGIHGAEGRFELDYWGPSYKQAIERVLAQDSRPTITAAFHNLPGELNAQTLPPELRQRVQIVPFEQAEYFFTNFRDQYRQRPPYPETASVTVDGTKVLSVYRMR